jgi:hypothetical protein
VRRAVYSSNRRCLLLDPCCFVVQLVLVHAKNALTPFNPPSIVMLCRLLAFVVVLALANLGTSFASAVLAKDTTTSNGQLVDKKTNEAVATATAVETYTVQEDNGENARRLAECTSTSMDAYDACNTTVSSNTTMSNTSALAMLRNCEQGTEYVQLLRTFTSENITTIMTTTVCGPGWCSGESRYTMNTEPILVDQDRLFSAGSIPVAGQLCIHDSTEKLNVTKTINNPGTYTLSRDMFVVPTGNAPTASPTTASPTTRKPTASPTTRKPTASPTTATPTTIKPTASPTTRKPTASPTTATPTTIKPTGKPTTRKPTAPTTKPTTKNPGGPVNFPLA